MKRYWRGITLGVLAYLVFMVVNAPAAKVLPRLQPDGVRIAGIEGSLWSGQAALASVAPLSLEAVHWDFRLAGLLLGRPGFAVEARLLGRPLQADVGVSLLGKPYITDLRGRLGAADLLRLMKINAQLTLAGELTFEIDSVELSGAGYPAWEGDITWAPARLLQPVALDFGKVVLDTRIEDGITRGKLNGEGGSLRLDADVELQPDGAYRLDARLQQTGNTPPAVGQFLSSFAEYRDGTYHLEWSDRL